ncbi:NifU family protein [Deltaproteobacteria bacterium TL4]
MFKFTNFNKKEPEEEKFQAKDYQISAREFFSKRRKSVRPHVFDLRSSEDYEFSHIEGAHSLPIEHVETSIYQMPFSGDILLYGSDNGEVFSAAEILYDNGFDNFFFVESYTKLLGGVDETWFTITDAARELIAQKLSNPAPALRGIRLIADSKTPLKAAYSVEWVSETPTAEEIEVTSGTIQVWVPRKSVPFLDETVVDVEEGELTVRNAIMGLNKLQGTLEERVRMLLEDQVNPMLSMHGGRVNLLGIEGDIAYVEFAGGCHGCGMVDVTLKQGVSVIFKENIPEIREVLDNTDHAHGHNPYFQPSTK